MFAISDIYTLIHVHSVPTDPPQKNRFLRDSALFEIGERCALKIFSRKSEIK